MYCIFCILKQLSILNIPPATKAKVFTFLCDETTVTVLQTSLSENMNAVCSNPIIICSGGKGFTYICVTVHTIIHANDRIFYIITKRNKLTILLLYHNYNLGVAKNKIKNRKVKI